MGGAEQRRDARGGVGAHQPVGAAVFDAQLLQSVEVAQQLFPFRGDLRLAHQVLDMLLHGERQKRAEHMAADGGV